MNSESSGVSILLETQYLPPVSVFVMMQSFSTIVINSEENFQKSTWRNRCAIVNANGPLLLTIPIVGGRGVRSKTKDVRIAIDQSWKHVHWRSLQAAYGKSSFFFFYEDKFWKIYEKKFEFLIDFNTDLLQLCFEILHWEKTVSINIDENDSHFLQTVKLHTVNYKPYRQVFESKHGFIPEVSIMDLIFNLGNDASDYLSKQKAL